MSRIHEALKKAAQERSAQLAAGTAPSFLEVAGGPRRAVPLRGLDEPTSPEPSPAKGASFLRYEDLIKGWATPKWKTDARMSVIEGGEGGHGGAERVST